MDHNKLQNDLVNDEGLVLYAYEDSESFLTIGVGRLIDKRKNGGITEAEAMMLLDNDIALVESNCAQEINCWDALDDTRQRALANMCFQLGIDGLLKFKHMLKALNNRDWHKAHDEALFSKWAKETPKRAHRIADMLLHG